MKKIITLHILILFSFFVKGQTNVSGGIYSNTTWTKANSPYIVVDTVVVFPNVTLTIEPGVSIRFKKNKLLEVRQATIMAIGTVSDSITFTSDSLMPTPGIWAGIYLNKCIAEKFNFCNFMYANKVIRMDHWGAGDSLVISNSLFENNVDGFDAYSANIDTCIFQHNKSGIFWQIGGHVNFCNFSYNQLGIYASQINITNSTFHSNQTGMYIQQNTTIKNCFVDSNSFAGVQLVWGNDLIRDCQIRHNGIGIYDSATPTYGRNTITKNIIDSNVVGIKVEHWQDSIYCNKICNSTSYGFYNNTSSNAVVVANNYWCTTDSFTISNIIYDGYDNFNLGLVSFMPIDNEQCYLKTGISIYELENTSINIYPNPLTTSSFLQLNTQLKDAEIVIYDILGKEMVRKKMNGDKMEIEKGSLESGVYFVRVSTAERQWVQKIVVE